MSPFPHGDLPHLISTYGYWAVALFVAIESVGIPVPGEAALIAAAIYGGSTHELNIALVIAAAAAGAIIGDNVGFWLGRELGYRLLLRYGRSIGLTEPRLKLGQYLFMRYGGVIVFFGRFVALLRALAAFLAGTNCMGWRRFLIFNAAGGIVWATLYGMSAYLLGREIHRFRGPVDIAGIVIGGIIVVVGLVLLHRQEKQLEAAAERALPGPLRPPRFRKSRGSPGS